MTCSNLTCWYCQREPAKITPKPLSKKELDRIKQVFDDDRFETGGCMWYVALAQDLLAAEAFWREAVKNGPSEGEWGECAWCGESFRKAPHDPNCLWLIAQQ